MTDRDFMLADCSLPRVYRGRVQPEWIDVNAHMNVAWYVAAFDLGIDGLWHEFGLSDARRDETGSTTFAVQSNVRYLNELHEGERFVVAVRILGSDDKRLHQFQYLFSEDSGRLAATCEWLHLHVDLERRRVAPWPADLLDNIRAHPAAQGNDAWPAAVGQVIAIPQPHAARQE